MLRIPTKFFAKILCLNKNFFRGHGMSSFLKFMNSAIRIPKSEFKLRRLSCPGSYVVRGCPEPNVVLGFFLLFLLFFNQSFSTGRLSVLAIFLFISIILVSLYTAGDEMAYRTSCLDTPQLLAISAYPIFFLRSSILISNGVMGKNID